MGIQTESISLAEKVMTLSHLIAAIHLITLGIGYGFIWMRAYQLSRVQDTKDLKAVFFADNMYGLAALLWIATGLWRAFGGLEKGTDYYLASQTFWMKMGLFAAVFACEIYPMIVLIRWRLQLKKGQEPDLGKGRLLSRLSYAELLLLSAMVLVAVMMARGW
jgi:putative membrane protein